MTPTTVAKHAGVSGRDRRRLTEKLDNDDRPPQSAAVLSVDSDGWLRRLRADGSERDGALADLHQLLVRVARAEAGRRRSSLPDAVRAELDDLCVQAANDALIAVTAKLDDFEGRSRFTTWASKFAIFELSTRLRRHAWRDGAVRLDEADWSRLPDASPATPERLAQQRELVAALRRAVDEVLTPRQREVFVAAVVQEVPIDVLAERLDVGRGAVYKTLHDARRKLRRSLASAGLEVTS